MNKEMIYFKYFSSVHIHSFIFSILLSTILLIIPKLCGKKCRKLNYNNFLKKYSIFLGILTLCSKIFDSIYRVLYQNEKIFEVQILYLCNFALIFSSLYLIFRTNALFNITYYLSFGAVLALILPGVVYYYSPFYVYVFMVTHVLELVAVIFGFYYYKEKVTFKGFKIAVFTLICIFIYAFIYNYIFRQYNTNAMFLTQYIVPFVSFIKPFWLYRVVLIVLMTCFLYVMYLISLLFNKKNN